jgi:hypothetical protein
METYAMFHAWKWFTDAAKTQARTAVLSRRPQRRQLLVEALEDRRLLSPVVTATGGWTVAGTVSSANGWHTAAILRSPDGNYQGVVDYSAGPSTANFTPLGAAVVDYSGATYLRVGGLSFSPDSTTLYYTGYSMTAVPVSAIVQNPTSVAMSSITPAGASYGDLSTYTAIVSVPAGTAAPKGGVVGFFADNSPTPFAEVPVQSLGTISQASAYYYTSGGSHTITAAYDPVLPGVNTFPAGYYSSQMSAPMGQSVAAAASKASLSESTNSSIFGQSVTFTASVAPQLVRSANGWTMAIPTGSVSF